MKKRKKNREPVSCQLGDISDELGPIIAFVRILGRAYGVEAHDADNDDGQWMAHEIENRLRKIDRKLDRIRKQLNRKGWSR